MSVKSSTDWAALQFHKAKAVPLDATKNMFLVTKCPNCQKVIRFSIGGTFGLGWSLRTFYCKQCKQTHSITMLLETKVISDAAITWTDLSQSLLRQSGTRVLSKAHSLLPHDVDINDPAKLLGYSSRKIAGWLKAHIHIFIQHLESTQREKGLHALELEGLQSIILKLSYIRKILNYYTKED
jgi:hypothetical protein